MIDFHTSYHSSALFESLAARSTRGHSVAEGLARLPVPREAPSASSDRHLADWLGALDQHRIAHAISLAGCEEEIPLLAEAAQRSKGRLVAFAPFDPSAKGAPARAIHLLDSVGFAGVVLDPARDGYRLADDQVDEALREVDDHGGIAIVHCGVRPRALERAFAIAEPFDPAAADPLELLTVAERHPSLPLVVPRFGGGYFRELLLLGAECPSVRVDTSSLNEWMRTQPTPLRLVDVFERTLAVFGAHRILFGSDSVDPRAGWRQAILTHQREALGACGITAEERELVFDGNARLLLGLPVPSAGAVAQPH